MSRIPEARSPRFYEKKWVVETAAIFPPIVAMGVATATNLMDPAVGKQRLGWLLLAGVVWLIVASFIKVANAYSQDRQQESEREYDGLNGALHAIHSSVAEYVGFSDEEKRGGRLRTTIHRVVPSTKSGRDPEETEQLLPDIGGSGKAPGRKFSTRSGIVGKAVREEAPFVAVRESDDYEEYIRDLVSVWSFTETDARSLSPDRQAWMAIPIFGSSREVVAVVYLDANERTLFEGDVPELIIGGCGGVTRYIEERYG